MEINNSIYQTLGRIQDSLQLTGTQYADLLGFTQKEYDSLLLDGEQLKIQNLLNLSQATELSIDRIMDGDIDFHALAKKHLGDKFAIPEKYAIPTQALARARTVKAIMHHVNSIHGEAYGRHVLRRLQIHPDFFSNPEDYINPFIITDLIETLVRSGFDRSHVKEMGKCAMKVNQNTAVGSLLSQAKTPMDLYRDLHEIVINRHFDRIFEYRIQSLSKTGITVTVTPIKDSHEALNSKLIGDRETCLYKQGVYSSFIGHIDHQFAKLFETACIYQGDPQCRYHLCWA
jgi:hypothetical protein